jgi:hypothetical protein
MHCLLQFARMMLLLVVMTDARLQQQALKCISGNHLQMAWSQSSQ